LKLRSTRSAGRGAAVSAATAGGMLGASFGLTAVYWVGFVVAVLVAAATWRMFTREALGATHGDSNPIAV
jgi:hypothetical protein